MSLGAEDGAVLACHMPVLFGVPASIVSVLFLIVIRVFYFFFFFQAEDGIRDKLVTGVQTCALPIFLMKQGFTLLWVGWQFDPPRRPGFVRVYPPTASEKSGPITGRVRSDFVPTQQIGRASCRERV